MLAVVTTFSIRLPTPTSFFARTLKTYFVPGLRFSIRISLPGAVQIDNQVKVTVTKIDNPS